LLLAAASLALASLAGCGRAAAAPLPRTAPATLAETGLYADFAAKTVAWEVWPYDPQYPLWTDGALKRRWISLPPGTWIDASDADDWIFPEGTRLWKEFSLGGRRVETRYLEKLAGGAWLRASYAWSEDESEASLAPERGLHGAAHGPDGTPYDIPARADCATCHARGDGVLGFGALQLSSDRDPLAPHATVPAPVAQDLATFVERGLVRGLPTRFLMRPPRIEARTPRERAALGYLHGQCGSCHWGGGLLAGLGLELDARIGSDPTGSRALASLVGRESRFRPSGAPESCTQRVEPGAPERSSLVDRMKSRDPLAQMPPVGTRVADREALSLLEAWIAQDLASSSDPEQPH